MKKGKRKPAEDIRAEYNRSDFGNLVRGKYASRVAEETNIVVLEPEVARAFPNDEAVNQALRGLMKLAEATARRKRRSAGGSGKRRTG